MKEVEELNYITVPRDDEALENMYNSLDRFTEKFGNNKELVDKIYDLQNGMDDLDVDVADTKTDERLEESTNEIKNFYQYIQVGDNFKKFIDQVKTMDDGEQEAENIINGLIFLSKNQKIKIDINGLLSNDFEIIDENALAENKADEPEDEEEKEKKKEIPQKRYDFDEINSIYSNITVGHTNLSAPTEKELVADVKTERLMRDASLQEEAIAYSFAMDDMLDEMKADLIAFRYEFASAQKNKEANFGGAAEGPKDYQRFTQSLNECIDALQRRKQSGITMGELAEKYNKMMNLGQKYQIEHKPKFRSHRTPESAKRYEIMGRFNDKGIASVNAFNKMYNELKEDMGELGEKNLSIKDIKCSEFKSTIFSKCDGDEDILDEYKSLSAIKNNIRDEKIRERLEKKILNNIKRLNSNFSGLKIDEYFEDKRPGIYKNNSFLKDSVFTAWDYAQAYVTKEIIDRVNDASSIEELNRIFEETKNKTKFDQKVQDLSANPAFQATTKLSKDYSFSIWQSAQEKKVQSLDEMEGKFIDYVNKVEKNPNGAVDSRFVSNLLLGLMIKHPLFQKSSDISNIFAGFKHDNYSGLASKKGAKALQKYVENNKDLLARCQKMTRANVKQMLIMLDDPKIIDNAAKIMYKAYNKVLNDKFSIIKGEIKERDNQRKAEKKMAEKENKKLAKEAAKKNKVAKKGK